MVVDERIGGGIRVVVIVSLTMIAAIVYILSMLCKRFQRCMLVAWYTSCLKVLRIRIHESGTPCARRPLLVVGNHISYLDILVIGSRVDAVFVAKEEVAHWPMVGLLSRMVGTVFIRRRPLEVLQERQLIAQKLAAGHTIVLFPEGTTSPGSCVLPFKSSLFSVMVSERREREVWVQPITLAYCAQHEDCNTGAGATASLAWHGDDRFLPHLWKLLAASRRDGHYPLAPTYE